MSTAPPVIESDLKTPRRAPTTPRVDQGPRAGWGDLRASANTDALQGPAHRLRRGDVPQYGRMLGFRNGDLLDAWGCLHATCGFCDIKHGRPAMLDWGEAERVAQAVKAMNLRHAVITSVNRDDRGDGGAPLFAMVIRRIRELLPGCSIEVLIPDFKGSLEALKIVMEARPEILNHNVETVPRLFKKVQPQDNYDWAARTLTNAKHLDPDVLTKSGIMLGLGEEMDEVKAVMRDQRSWGVDILTIGQYLQPSKKHLPSPAITRWKNSWNSRIMGERSASNGSNPRRWLGVRIMPENKCGH